MAKGKYVAKHAGRVNMKPLALILALVLTIGGVIGGTVAWLIATPDPVINTFTYGDINIELDETDTGLELYLSDEAVDAVTGGLISASATIKNTTSVNFICEFCGYGETIDITNKNIQCR